MNLEGIDKLMEIIPQQYSDALKIYPWLSEICKSHEWDNRTTVENIGYVISYYLHKIEGKSDWRFSNSNQS